MTHEEGIKQAAIMGEEDAQDGAQFRGIATCRNLLGFSYDEPVEFTNGFQREYLRAFEDESKRLGTTLDRTGRMSKPRI